jgi:ATP-dependent helicase/nuclease subunit B
LPLVFVPGLTERHFPQYHREDAIVGDAARRRAGLDTAADREKEEHFLFDLATTRATEETVLSYPRFDESGQQSLPSFFLNGAEPQNHDDRIRPIATRTITPTPYTPIDAPNFAARKLSASAIDSYVQCPFQFLMKKSLRLVERPKAPRDRLNVLLQGTIIHRAFAEWSDKPLLGTALLEDAFDALCAKERVPKTYRTEAVRLELLRHFEAFLRDHTVELGWRSRVEEQFEFELHPGLVLHGRLDRVDENSAGQALVIDYKYSAAARLKGRLEESESGNAVQAGVYLLAAQRALKLQPVGMLYCHVKKGVAWDGWQANIPGLDVGEKRTEAGVAEIAKAAEETVLRVYSDIAAGRVVVEPREDKPCDWCDCRDICRKESIVRIHTAVSQ